MIDRGIIKWQPFNSCFNARNVIEDISKEKERERTKLPILSEDQWVVIENRIKTAYCLKLPISINYYYDEEIKTLQGKITYFDYLNKKIYINNKEIYFNQIVKIGEC